MTSKRWEHFAHEADIGVRGIGASKAEAFEQGAVLKRGGIALCETLIYRWDCSATSTS